MSISNAVASAVIEIRGATFRYADSEQEASIRDVDLSVQAGECVLLCGLSGCGKTTLTRLVNGLVPHYYEGELTGSVRVCGLNVSSCELHETAGLVGSVFQNPRSQFFTVNATSEIAFGCENVGLPEDEIVGRVDAVARKMGVECLLGRNLFDLSGGEKQRVACASVAALRPQVLVLDEPSSNLDMAAIADVRRQIAAWKAEGRTVLIAEHRLFYLKNIVDRVVYLQEGRIVETLSWNELEALSASELAARGLRTPDLDSLRTAPVLHPAQGVGRGGGPALGIGQISLLNLSCSYDGKSKALDVQSLTLPRGKVTAIIGGNGAGKTTFSRCACGLQRGSAGVLWIDGTTYKRRARRRRCFMVMQDVNHQLFTESVAEEVLLSMAEPDDARADAILAGLGLLELRELHPLSLSGGQKQRVAIASAVASERDLVVFDEPTSGLDHLHMTQVAENLAGLERAGKTVIVITHDPEFVLTCCQHVARLERGRLMEDYPLNSEGRRRMLAFFTNEGRISDEARTAKENGQKRR